MVLAALGQWSCSGSTNPSLVSTPEDLIARLQATGASVQRAGQSSADPLFMVPGTVLSINGSGPRVNVYEYPTGLRAAEVAASVPGETVKITWIATPHVYRAGRLLVVYVGISQDVLGLLAQVLGPPVYSHPSEYDLGQS